MLDRVTSCQAALRSARAEEKHAIDAELQRVSEAKAALVVSVRVREEAAAALAAARREEAP